MLGMDQNQRSNAVGANTAYLPSGDPGRDGGGTYSGQITEPTIQDYENFFGPSARDIKTDLQRFKRHGRWHLPDVLQGPNPWLTDRIDGLITDATNSPFTTKILPYRYKEDVDGKIKWNVWSFDEGMASRVPYESAARTLTQSKRSFSGYMVRQGMAIVLEHNFMMTPKGRENFKNQLNQLIGSIQYTNDLDVHMALILAPSYQKTMQERYYTTDKSPSQMCREYADLFGMMQKNVNALDILIEEGKAILRTWGGPMPDFLLCNSKLTFQLTMTPEKTNYITQGIDGVKRLRQGPDLGSYRGLSIIHTRSFAMETGQHPRDVLRRRVRTAEYYRIPPDSKNASREFEFYNEERDNFFTLSFLDLLKCARYQDMTGTNNADKIDNIIDNWSASAGTPAMASRFSNPFGSSVQLGAGYAVQKGQATDDFFREFGDSLSMKPLATKYCMTHCDVTRGGKTSWTIAGFSDSMGIRYIYPGDGNEFWEKCELIKQQAGQGGNPWSERFAFFSPLPKQLLSDFYNSCKNKQLNDILRLTSTLTVAPSTPEWHANYLYYLECIKRQGLPTNFLQMNFDAEDANLLDVEFKDEMPDKADLSCQFLTMVGAAGSVNHKMHMITGERLTSGANESLGAYLARNLLLTVESVSLFLGKYDEKKYNIDVMIEQPEQFIELFDALKKVKTNDIWKKSELFAELCSRVSNLPKLPEENFSELGVSTIPMLTLSSSHWLNKANWVGNDMAYRSFLRSIATTNYQLNQSCLEYLIENPAFLPTLIVSDLPAASKDVKEFFKTIKSRLFDDPFQRVISKVSTLSFEERARLLEDPAKVFILHNVARAQESAGVSTMFPESVESGRINLNSIFGGESSKVYGESTGDMENVEIVVIRPNIEHNMLGVIMGLGGEQLGNTLWGQTELSVYDDSMHGIWGMSYKYHERAIVFYEKNLIRMWDIAYDGYNGGKDDTYVNWTKPQDVDRFKEATLTLERNYRGQSMMVMAFVHDKAKVDPSTGKKLFDTKFQRNWPSPIVFYDSYNPGRQHENNQEVLPLDYDNLQTVNVDEFRVFNNDLYYSVYNDYRHLMPDFRNLHITRKSAGQSSADAETGTDCLAFQGTMRVKEGGRVTQEIQGSGHHGPDYVGMASVRAGKGQKMAGQAPTLHRLI